MCVCLFLSRLSPCTVLPLPSVCRNGVACRMGKSEEKRAKDRQDKDFWLTKFTTYEVFHVQGLVVRFRSCALFRVGFCPPPFTLLPFYK